MTSNFISIRSVIYDLALTIDERYYNETKMLEWATKALHIIGPEVALEATTAQVAVTQHMFSLPCDLKYLTQIAYKEPVSPDSTCDVEFPPNSTMMVVSGGTAVWKPMRLSSSSLHTALCLDSTIIGCTTCDKEFSISPSMVATTTLESGTVLIAYLRYPKTVEGDALIPDDESLKEALLHYILYRYWMSKYMTKEDGAESRTKFHLEMWETLSTKAKGRLNMPDVNQLENLAQIHNKLVPRNRYRKFFRTSSSYADSTF